MAFVVCPKCEKNVYDREEVCPNCGSPILASEKVTDGKMPLNKMKKKVISIILISVTLIILAAGGIAGYIYVTFYSPAAVQYKEYCSAVQLYNDGEYAKALAFFEQMNGYENSTEMEKKCKYELGKAAMTSFDWETAILYFTDLSYSHSDDMLVDCSFMVALKESILRRMEKVEKGNSDSRVNVSTELAYLDTYRNAVFFDKNIQEQAAKYLMGLDMQLASLTYDFYYEYQDGWYTGLVERYEALDYLYTNYEFMKENPDFVGVYINQLEYYEGWLTAFRAMETTGHIEKDWKFTSNYVEIYFKNDTPYTSSQVFELTFWGDEEQTKYLGNTSVTLCDIGAYSEYKVRAYYTTEAKESFYSSGVWVHWSNYYQEIKVN